MGSLRLLEGVALQPALACPARPESEARGGHPEPCSGAQTRTPFGLKLVILPSTVRSVLAHKCAPRTSKAAAAGCLHTASSPQGSNRAGDPRKAHCLVARTGFGKTSLATQQGAQLTRRSFGGVSTHNPNTVRVVFVSRCELRAMHARNPNPVRDPSTRALLFGVR